MDSDKTREALAELAHSQWSGWMKYLFSNSQFNHEDHTYTIPEWAVKQWARQMQTDYKNLSEGEKDSDRAEADKVMVFIERAFKDGYHVAMLDKSSEDNVG